MPILTQAPDPNPKTPTLALPPGSCDTHIHLFGPADRYPFAPDSPYTSRDALAETYIALQDKLGLARAVIVSGGGYGRDYRLMADTLARYPIASAALRCCRKTRAPPSSYGSPASACAACA
jgi:2-pyrone-4,6-dicarboxylate lactonase